MVASYGIPGTLCEHMHTKPSADTRATSLPWKSTGKSPPAKPSLYIAHSFFFWMGEEKKDIREWCCDYDSLRTRDLFLVSNIFLYPEKHLYTHTHKFKYSQAGILKQLVSETLIQIHASISSTEPLSLLGGLWKWLSTLLRVLQDGRLDPSSTDEPKGAWVTSLIFIGDKGWLGERKWRNLCRGVAVYWGESFQKFSTTRGNQSGGKTQKACESPPPLPRGRAAAFGFHTEQELQRQRQGLMIVWFQKGSRETRQSWIWEATHDPHSL